MWLSQLPQCNAAYEWMKRVGCLTWGAENGQNKSSQLYVSVLRVEGGRGQLYPSVGRKEKEVKKVGTVITLPLPSPLSGATRSAGIFRRDSKEELQGTVEG